MASYHLRSICAQLDILNSREVIISQKIMMIMQELKFYVIEISTIYTTVASSDARACMPLC